MDRSLSAGLARWRHSRARHDPAKVLIDLATAVALGGDCAADLAVVRAQPQVFGPVASDPTVSRLVAALAGDIDRALPAIRAARAAARAAVWHRRRALAGTPRSQDGGLVVVDLDSTIVTAHSDKQGAQPTYKRSFASQVETFPAIARFVDTCERPGPRRVDTLGHPTVEPARSRRSAGGARLGTPGCPTCPASSASAQDRPVTGAEAPDGGLRTTHARLTSRMAQPMT